MADQIIQGQQPSTILVQKSDSQKSIRPGFVKVLVAILFMLLCPLLFFELFNISLQESQLKFWIIFVTFILSINHFHDNKIYILLRAFAVDGCFHS